ncbi:Cd22 [Phodopus roborovskii]|uniref:B-cell receptor CD22 n=1 Tax=Phodopus roborovskii TaxID=109678 RepID=A0AAV0A8G6_PHORO|nr:Cd22 [Phodopus roborovskii]
MNIHCPWLLLTLGQVALFDSWTVHHPQTIFAWEGACVWIPCQYKRLNRQVNQVHKLEKVLLYQNYTFDNNSKDFKGIVLYNDTKMESSPSKHGRVTFHGDRKDNCTLEIHPIHANDSGQLGLRMVWGEDKWMEHVSLNISATPFPPYIMVPTEIQASQSVTLTCRLNFACFGYPVHLEWSLKKPETTTTSTTTTVKNVYTESNLTFHPEWMDHGKNVTCQVLHSTQVLSENTVRLDVKHIPQLTIEASSREVRTGDSVTMICRVTSSNPDYSKVSWVKDGHPLQEQELTLTLNNVTKDKSGKYRCRAFNDLGLGQSEEVALTVLCEFP